MSTAKISIKNLYSLHVRIKLDVTITAMINRLRRTFYDGSKDIRILGEMNIFSVSWEIMEIELLLAVDSK